VRAVRLRREGRFEVEVVAEEESWRVFVVVVDGGGRGRE